MNTDALIETLSRDLQPVSRHASLRRMLFGLAGGGLVTVLGVAVILGLRDDLGLAMRGYSFWMKWAYTISLGSVASIMVARLARPEPINMRRFWPIAIPFVLLVAVAFAEMAQVPPAEWLKMWLGHTWEKCPWLVLILSLPIFVGLFWALRRLAPTRLRAAGAAAGLAAGAWAATLYCLHCPEVSALFVLTWYSLGIGLAASLGACVGPRLLRW